MGAGKTGNGEKVLEKIWRVYVGFMEFEKVYDRLNRETLGHPLRMHEVCGIKIIC